MHELFKSLHLANGIGKIKHFLGLSKLTVCHHYQNHLKKINKAIANATICSLPSLFDISHLLKKYQGERVIKNSVTHNFKMDRTHIYHVKLKFFTLLILLLAAHFEIYTIVGSATVAKTL